MRSLAFSFLWLLTVAPAAAQTVIDFEYDDAGTSLLEGDDASAAFVAQGVSFYFVGGATHPVIAVEGQPSIAYSYVQGSTPFYDVASSGVNTVTDGPASAELGATFSDPVSDVSFALHDFGDCVPSVAVGAPVTLTLNAFDAAGSVVASDTYTVLRYGVGSPLDGHVATISLTGTGIVSAETSGLVVDCGWAIDDFTFTVENLPPVADPGEPRNGVEGSAISMSGGTSSDSDGTIVEYAWDCTDDGIYDVVGATATASCTYDDDGGFTVRLLVTDDDGSTDEATTAVTVANVDPTIDSTPSTEAAEGTLWTYQATRTDPAGENDPPTWSMTTAPAGMTVDAAAGLVEWTPSAADGTAGSANIELGVTDGDGGSDSQVFTLVVAGLGDGDDDDSGGDDDDSADDDDSGDDDDSSGDDDDASDDDDAAGDDDDVGVADCGCSVRSSARPGSALVFAVILVIGLAPRRRRL